MSDPIRLTIGPGEEDNSEFGELLERIRVRAGLSRGEAAKQIEVSSEYLRLIERGRRTPVFGSMPKILGTYHISFEIEPSLVIFEGYSVTFTSRIQEPRYTEIESWDRDTQIGQIVRLLTTAEDDMLRDIYRRLRRS